jgi:type I restriction enzyme, S subunit
MDVAQAARLTKLAEANSLLAGLDDYLLDTLDLNPPCKDERKVFAVMRSAAPARFDPHFHHPAFAQIQRMLAANGGAPLGNIATFSNEIWKPEKHDAPTFRYIEISSVDRETGEAQAVETPVSEAPSRARMAVHNGDIIVSLTRPHHGSIAQITPALDGCVASTGFSIIRNADGSRVMNDYLWCVLRRKICLMQMLQRASGGNYPAITEPELAKVLIPIPTMDIQNTIAAEARRRSDESRRLRAEADSGWQAAKIWFEEQLLGPVHK